jgi:hypothetical protein
MRLAVRAAEDGLRRLQEASMMAGDWRAEWGLVAARAKLRQVERHFAATDDHPEPLKALSPRVRERVSTQPRRRRYRCSGCFTEVLMSDADVERPYGGHHFRHRTGNRLAEVCGDWEPVARMPRGKAKT